MGDSQEALRVIGRATLVLALGLAPACTLESGALGTGDAGPTTVDAAAGPADDGSERPRDGGPGDDGGTTPGDGGPGEPCLPMRELCNGRDDDCDGTVDEEVCAGCLVGEIAEAIHVFCVEPVPWIDAREWCRDQGLDLMVVDDLEEDRAAQDQARILRATGWWIGLDDRATEGTYVWVDGRTAWADGTARTFTNFTGGRPADHPPEDCIQTDGSAPEGVWRDARCDVSAPFVCEGPRPEPEDDDPPKTPGPDLDP